MRNSLNRIKIALISFICILLSLGLISQSLTPVSLNSAGDDYFSSQAIMNVSIGEVAIQTYTQSSAILNEGFQHPNMGDYFQNITIPLGWSGISSYIIPNDSLLDTIYAGFTADTLIISDFGSLYILGLANNEIVYWKSHAGKRIKVNEEYIVKYYGARLQNPIIQIDSGWNILPVLRTCQIRCDTIQALIGNSFEMIIEIGSDRVYWPQKNILSLLHLHPGKAYYLKSSQTINFQYPNCN